MMCHYRCFLILLILASAIDVAAQRSNEAATRDPVPKEVRGYKVERSQVEIKKTKDSKRGRPIEDEEVLIRFGEARLVALTPLGVSFDLPVIVAAVKQQGEIDLLVFEDMHINNTPVTIEDYVRPFALPNKQPLTLAQPLRVFVSAPQAVLTTIGELLNSQEVWPVTGRIYVCGQFKKFLFRFKRAVPVELQASINNPLRQR